jgi:hypothetical protein
MQVLFFATNGDLLPVLDAVEAEGSLRYAIAGRVDACEVFTRGTELPQLRVSDAESAVGCRRYLVSEPETQVILRDLNVKSGGRFAVDQLANPDTVVLTPGGSWRDVVLNGGVATASDSPGSQRLMRRFRQAIQREFVRVKAFWVGPSAMVLLEAGKRLTGAEQSPRELDLEK